MYTSLKTPKHSPATRNTMFLSLTRNIEHIFCFNKSFFTLLLAIRENCSLFLFKNEKHIYRSKLFHMLFSMLIPSLYTIALSMAPIIELRGAIPVGYFVFDLPLWYVALISIAGNILAVAIVLWILPKVVIFFSKWIPIIHKVMEWVFEKTRAKHSHKMVLWGEIALILFVAIPLPGSGGWTGALLAYLFDVKYKNALGLMSVGIIIAAIIVSLLCLGGGALADMLISTKFAPAPDSALIPME